MLLQSNVLSDVEIFSNNVIFNNKSCWNISRCMSDSDWQILYFANRSRLIFGTFKCRCWNKGI